MNKKKNIYDFYQAAHDKLFIRLVEDGCEIEHVSYRSDDIDGFDPERSAAQRLCIPKWLLPMLKEGIDMALTEWKRECPVKAPEPEEEVPF